MQKSASPRGAADAEGSSIFELLDDIPKEKVNESKKIDWTEEAPVEPVEKTPSPKATTTMLDEASRTQKILSRKRKKITVRNVDSDEFN